LELGQMLPEMKQGMFILEQMCTDNGHCRLQI